MTKQEFEQKVDMAVEIEYETGGRHWTVMKGSEVDAYIDGLGEYASLSDVDYSYKQEFEEVRNLLDKAEDIWFNHKEWWQERNFTYLGQVIDALLEDDSPKKRVWSQEEIKNLIQTNDEVLYRALKKLYSKQTSEEQRKGDTVVNNNVGFNGADAKFLSSTAEFLKKAGFLTPKQKVVVRKKMVKYTKQLTRLANE